MTLRTPPARLAVEQASQLADKLLRANFGRSVGFTSLLILVRLRG